MRNVYFPGMAKNFSRESEGKQLYQEMRRESRCLFFPLYPLQDERDDSNYNEEYHKPFCDLHRKSGYPPCASQVRNQGKHKEDYRKIDQISHGSLHGYFFFNVDPASWAAIFASATTLWTPIFTSSDRFCASTPASLRVLWAATVASS
jgi:hypothetical protein